MVAGNIMNGGKINILFIIDGLEGIGGGAENHLADVVANLNKDLFKCFVCSFKSDNGLIVRKIKQRVAEFVPLSVGRLLSVSAFRNAIHLRQFILKHNIHIVQTFLIKSDTYGAIIARFSGVPIIISSRRDMGDLKERKHLFLNRLVNPFIDHFIAVCDSVRESVAAIESIPLSKITTIYNGVDIKRFDKLPESQIKPFRELLEVYPDDFVVGSVAHFRPEKAYHIFFEGIKKVKEEIKNLKVVCVGYPLNLGKHFVRYCEEEKMDCFIRFVGGVEDVRPYMQLMDVLCLIPNSNEGFSNSILQGMAMGKPIIASDVGGNRESVIHRKTGLIIPPDNSDAFADAILELYKNRSLRLAMGEEGRKRIESEFTTDRMINRMENLYNDLLKAKNIWKGRV